MEMEGSPLVVLPWMQSYRIKSLRQVGDSDSRLFGHLYSRESKQPNGCFSLVPSVDTVYNCKERVDGPFFSSLSSWMLSSPCLSFFPSFMRPIYLNFLEICFYTPSPYNSGLYLWISYLLKEGLKVITKQDEVFFTPTVWLSMCCSKNALTQPAFLNWVWQHLLQQSSHTQKLHT